MMSHRKAQKGFTLIELSIVLVIIGLIVGGVLVGRDLVKAAEVRAQVSQISAFDSAIATFKVKYNSLPGDITNAHAMEFGITTQNWLGSCNCQPGGNENGLIEEGGVYPVTVFVNEAYLFFIHLAKAKLIADISGNVDYPNGVRGCSSNGNYHHYVGCQFPAAKIGVGGFLATSLSNGRLAYFLGMTATDANAAFNNYSIATASDGLGVITPTVAFALDTKLDDGLPLTGKIQATQYPATAETRTNYCLTSVANNTYYIANPASACNLLIQSSAQ